MIVIQDAATEGFVCRPAQIGDPVELKKIYKRIAKFHAASYFLAETVEQTIMVL